MSLRPPRVTEAAALLPVPQVCKVVAGQRIPSQYVPNVAADIVDIAAVPPSNRFNKVRKCWMFACSTTSRLTPCDLSLCCCVPEQIVSQVNQFRSDASGLLEKFGLTLTPQVRAPPEAHPTCRSVSLTHPPAPLLLVPSTHSWSRCRAASSTRPRSA